MNEFAFYQVFLIKEKLIVELMSRSLLVGGISISAVEQETKISKDTLRVWERRYGFPQPLRDTAKDRIYPWDQVERLKLIRSLVDSGHRPGKIVHLSESGLRKLLEDKCGFEMVGATRSASGDIVAQIFETVASHDKNALHYRLTNALMRMGVMGFLKDVVIPLNIQVGEAWARGDFEVSEEHLYTEIISNVLRSAIAVLGTSHAESQPRVLLTTLPQEQHGLGLLMVEIVLTLEGCLCISLGTQTPIPSIVHATKVHRIDIVALSFTDIHTRNLLNTSLSALRRVLPESVDIWAGGSCRALYQKEFSGITASSSLEELSRMVHQWRISHAVSM
ncbi:MerR family transcriptional regulator [Comamonas kerstersii]|uniref:MerR family transcriptional regulator n=1 Tax=Comamonas kerstersii TaxID=225992 RepID=UPI00345C7CD1